MQRGQLALQVLALEREHLLGILGPDKLARQVEGRIHVMLGIVQDVRGDGLDTSRSGRVADDARGPLGDGKKTFEGLARLLDAAVAA